MILLRLITAGIRRNQLRAWLTIFAVALATLTFTLLRTVSSSWDSAAENAPRDRLVSRHKMSIAMLLPIAHVQQARRMPALGKVTYANYFGGKNMAREDEFFVSLAVDPGTYFDVYDDLYLDASTKERWLSVRPAAVVSRALAQRMGWKQGSKIMLVSGFYPEQPTWEFELVGFYEARSKAVDETTLYFRWDYFNSMCSDFHRDMVGWLISRGDDPLRAASAAARIDAMFAGTEAPTLTQDEHAFNTSFVASTSTMLTAIDVVSIVILLVIALVIANAMAMSIAERTSEYGTLRALGFSSRTVLGIIAAEASIVGIAGALLGLSTALPLVNVVIGGWIEANMGTFFPNFCMSVETLCLALALPWLGSLLAAAGPARRVQRLAVVDALRGLG